MTEINLFEMVGGFAENKDLAREIRLNQILPAISNGEEVILDFKNVDSATQSFIHALISDVIRQKGIEVMDRLLFKNCSKIVEKLISLVVDYMQEE